MNFRVIFRGLVEAVKKNKRRVSIAVQIRPSDATIMEYLTQYFDEARILVYWGTAREFVTELDRRWR